MAEPSMGILDNFCVVMCKQCKTIVAEGRNACVYNEVLKVIAFLSATKQVEVEDKLRYDVSSDLQGCVYSYLKCKVCGAKVGLLMNCAVAEVAYLRRLFCLFTHSTLCYSMKTRKLLEGNWFDINVFSCVTRIKDLEQELHDMYKHVKELAKKIQELQSPIAED